MSAADVGVAPPGYRLPASTAPGRVTLQVADLGRSVDYYTRVLGLELIERRRGAASLGPAGGAADPLVVLRERRGVSPVPRARRYGLFHFALLLPDRAHLGRFLRHLGALGLRPGMADHFVSEALYLYDPDGLGLEVYADRPRDRWRALDRELVMTTDPLDASGLTAAAGEAAWAGAPPGTRIGHLHLHVGDLDRASAFYHQALGLDRTVWNFTGALFLAAGGYHHHLATNVWTTDATPARDDEARLIEWELIVPKATDASNAARSLEYAGYPPVRDDRGWLVRDPWGTSLRLRGAASATAARP
jgi:catechol 2,3-dioxygenase